MTHPRADQDLLTHEQFSRYCQDRASRIDGQDEDLTARLDAQLLWWHVREVFVQHPGLEGFTILDKADTDDDFKTAVRLMEVAVEGTGDRQAMAQARDDLREALVSYAHAQPDGFFDLALMDDSHRTCRRHALGSWTWGSDLLDGAWAAMVASLELDGALPQGKPTTPGPRF